MHLCPLFFSKGKDSAFFEGLVDFNALDAAFHHQFPQEGMVQEGAFQYLQKQLDAQVQGLFPIALVWVAAGMVQHTAQILCAIDGTADPLQRTGADEACCLADEENAFFAFAELPQGGGTQHQTSLCFQGLPKAETDLLQLFLLPCKAFSGVIQRKSAAENELMILGDRPGAAIGGFGVEDAGIEGIRVGLREPLLDGEIIADLMVGIECPPDDRICAVCPYEEAGCDSMAFFLLQIGDGKAAVLSFQFCAYSVAVDFHTFRDDGFQPEIESMAIQIDVKPLVMADQLIFQVDGLDGEDLWVYQHILGQSQVEACQCFLGIGGDEPAAGLLEAICPKDFFINGNDFIVWAEQTRQCRAGGAQTDDSNIVIILPFHKNTPFLEVSVAQKNGKKRNA